MTSPAHVPAPGPRPRVVPQLRTTTNFQNYPLLSSGTDKRYIAAGTTVDTLIKAGPGRLCRVIVTQVGSAGAVIVDHDVSNGGDPLGAVPPNAPVGSVFDFQTPAIRGIRVPGAANLPGLVITYY